MFVGETMWRTGPSLHIVHRLVGRAGWILSTPASAEAAVDLNYQIIGCVAFWESFSISFSGWLALFTPLCQHLVCPHWCGMSVNEQYEAPEMMHTFVTLGLFQLSLCITFLSSSIILPEVTCNTQDVLQYLGHVLKSEFITFVWTIVPQSVCQGHEHGR